MAKTAAEILIDTLMDWGVEVVFGLLGDGIDLPDKQKLRSRMKVPVFWQNVPKRLNDRFEGTWIGGWD
ncbi:hypothetical protein L0152_04835 [bacterium]|nr:hypothetical protein [bacterium]